MVDQTIVMVVRNYLQTVHDSGLEVHFGVVFGSQSQGKADEWSDIDLLVVSPRFDNLSSRQDVDLLWRLAARSDSRIEPSLWRTAMVRGQQQCHCRDCASRGRSDKPSRTEQLGGCEESWIVALKFDDRPID